MYTKMPTLLLLDIQASKVLG